MYVALLTDLRFESISYYKIHSPLKIGKALKIYIIIFGSILSFVHFCRFEYSIINLVRKLCKFYISREKIGSSVF